MLPGTTAKSKGKGKVVPEYELSQSKEIELIIPNPIITKYGIE